MLSNTTMRQVLFQNSSSSLTASIRPKSPWIFNCRRYKFWANSTCSQQQNKILTEYHLQRQQLHNVRQCKTFYGMTTRINNLTELSRRSGGRNSSTSTSTYLSWSKRIKRMKSRSDNFMTSPLFPKWSEESSPSHIIVHSTFLLTGCAYLSKDILQLRCVAIGSIVLSMTALAFMPKVPKTPMLWNSFYLVINLAWCSLIYYERYEADRMDEEFEHIYATGKFEERGFSRLEFRRLFLRASKKEYPAGTKIKAIDKSDPELMYLAHGGVRVVKEGCVLRQYTKGKVFVGEVSFLPYLTGEDPTFHAASADIIVQPGGLTAYVWNYKELRNFLRKDRQTRNAVLAYISHDLRDKLITTSNQELALLQGRPVANSLARHGAVGKAGDSNTNPKTVSDEIVLQPQEAPE